MSVKSPTTWPSRREAIRESRVPGETPDQTPVHVPGKSDRPLTLREELRRFVRQELSRQAEEKMDAGSFQDEDDFEIPENEDDGDLTTPYTVRELYEDQINQDDLEGRPTEEDRTVKNLDTTTVENTSDSEQGGSPSEPPETPAPSRVSD